MGRLERWSHPDVQRKLFAVFCVLVALALLLGTLALRANSQTETKVREIGTQFIAIKSPPAVVRSASLSRAIKELSPHQARTLLNRLLANRTALQRLRMRGRQGPAGARGARGPRGRTGARGPRGLRGATGPRGVSVRGRAGSTGARGPQGVPGPQGPPGAAGQLVQVPPGQGGTPPGQVGKPCHGNKC